MSSSQLLDIPRLMNAHACIDTLFPELRLEEYQYYDLMCNDTMKKLFYLWNTAPIIRKE